MARACVIRQGWFPFDPRVRREVNALLSAGNEVDVISIRRDGLPLHERSGGLRVIRIPFPQSRRGGVGYVLQYAAFMAIAAVLVSGLHLFRRYRIVQVHSLPDPLVFAALVPRLLGATVVLDLHECMPEFAATKFGVSMDHPVVGLIARAEQASIRFAHVTITCTAQMREAFISRGADPARIGVVHNAAEEETWDSVRYPPRPRQPGRFTLICHGSLEPRYGLDTAIEAIALLRDEIPELELRVFGEGSQRDELKTMAAELGVADRVAFSRGFVPIDDLVAAVADSDAGIVAMKRDVFRDLVHCNKMYDLIAMRRPVISSRTRSVEAYFSDDAFLWFTADDPEDLARAIRKLYAEPELGDRLVEQAGEEVEPYRWPRQREQYKRYVLSAVSGSADGEV
jgi:glycosyltransferase involved in cell wall biosynthesis